MPPILKLIYNPASRGGKSKKVSEKIKNYLEDHNIEFKFVETKGPLDAINLAENAKEEGYDIVCSIGGDGTAHEVANGAIKSGITFGIIPAGSGNDFSKGIGLNGDWEQAINVILQGKEEELSVIKIGDRYSINVVDVGLGAVVSKRSLESLRWMKGSFKYTLLTLRSLLTHKPYPCKVVIDGKEYEYNLNILACGFGQSFGSGMLILPDASFDDEKMSIAVIRDASKFTLLRLFPKVFSGAHVNYEKYVTMLQGSKIEITPLEDDREVLAEAEGEMVGVAPITFQAVPSALKVMVPSDWTPSDRSLWMD